MGISLRFPVRKPRSGFLFVRGRISDCDNLRGHCPPACPGSNESKTQGTMTNIPERPRKADPRMERLMDALGELPEKKQALIQKRFISPQNRSIAASLRAFDTLWSNACRRTAT